MIFFFADDHYQTRAGARIFGNLPGDLRCRSVFRENDFSLLESGAWECSCELLVLHLIGGTCSLPHPGPGAEAAVRRYCARKGPMLLLHGSSAAFWQWPWWRRITGMRWVRPKDPDGVERSVHPSASCRVRLSKYRHTLTAQLVPFELPEDEIYTALEQTGPLWTLMECDVNGRTFPQCTESFTPWGGRVINFLPGHRAECVNSPGLTADAELLCRYLLSAPETDAVPISSL